MGDSSLYMVVIFIMTMLFGANLLAPLSRYIQQRAGFIHDLAGLPLGLALFSLIYSLHVTLIEPGVGGLLGIPLLYLFCLLTGWGIPLALTLRDAKLWKNLDEQLVRPYSPMLPIGMPDSRPMPRLYEHFSSFRSIFLPSIHGFFWGGVFLVFFVFQLGVQALNSDIFVAVSDAENLAISSNIQKGLQGIQNSFEFHGQISPLDYISFQLGASFFRGWMWLDSEVDILSAGGIVFHLLFAYWKALASLILVWAGSVALRPLVSGSKLFWPVSFLTGILFLICSAFAGPSESTSLAVAALFSILFLFWGFQVCRRVPAKPWTNPSIYLLGASSLGLSFLTPVSFGIVLLLFSSSVTAAILVFERRQTPFKQLLFIFIPITTAATLGVILGSVVFPSQNIFSGRPLSDLLEASTGQHIRNIPSLWLQGMFFAGLTGILFSPLPLLYRRGRGFLTFSAGAVALAVSGCLFLYLDSWAGWAVASFTVCLSASVFIWNMISKSSLEKAGECKQENAEQSSAIVSLTCLAPEDLEMAHRNYLEPVLHETMFERRFLTLNQRKAVQPWIETSLQAQVFVIFLIVLFLAVRAFILQSFPMLIVSLCFFSWALAAVCLFLHRHTSEVERDAYSNPYENTSRVHWQIPFISFSATVICLGMGFTGFFRSLEMRTPVGGFTLRGYSYLQKLHPFDNSLIRSVYTLSRQTSLLRLAARSNSAIGIKPQEKPLSITRLLEVCARDSRGRIFPGRTSLLLGLESVCLLEDGAGRLDEAVYSYATTHAGSPLNPESLALKKRLLDAGISHIIVGEKEMELFKSSPETLGKFFGKVAFQGKNYGIVEVTPD